MTLFDTISNEIKEAMKARNQVRLEALRGIKKVMLEARASKGANTEITDDEAIKIISKLAKQGSESADIYQKQNRPDLAESEMAQVEVFKEFLPEMLSDEKVEQVVKQIIETSGASGMKDMGRVMGLATKELAGKAEGRTISEIVKKLLQ